MGDYISMTIKISHLISFHHGKSPVLWAVNRYPIKVVEGQIESKNAGINKVMLKLFHLEYPRSFNACIKDIL